MGQGLPIPRSSRTTGTYRTVTVLQIIYMSIEKPLLNMLIKIAYLEQSCDLEACDVW